MSALPTLLPDASGVYMLPERISAVREMAVRARCRWHTVGLAGVRDKAGFLAACARDLGFPTHFGGNWDALADSINELAIDSAPGIVIEFSCIHEFAHAAAGDFATALAILRDAAAASRARNRIFIALLDAAPAGDMPAKFVPHGA